MKLQTPNLRSNEAETHEIVEDIVVKHLRDHELPFSIRVKYIGEQLLAGIALIVLAVPMLAIYLLVKITSPGGGFFRQARVGHGGHIFMMYKFRTMSLDAERESGPTWSSGGDDPRLTRVGKLLRFLHLDELPQLWNVLKGEMSLIGPRPERPAFVLMLAEEVDDYLVRLKVRPGITGLAQVYLDADQTIDCVRKKIFFDKFYIERQSLSLDFRIACCTMVRMMGFRHGVAPKYSGLNRQLAKSGLFLRSAPNAMADESPGQDVDSVFESDTDPTQPLPELPEKVMSISNGVVPFYSSDEAVSVTVRKPK